MKRLAGKTAVITGASSGIGFAIARRFVEEGARIFMTGRDAQTLNEAAAEIGSGATAAPGDITNLMDLKCLYEAIRASVGSLDIVVANAGANRHWKRMENITEEDFDDDLALNLKGTFFTVQGALPLLNNGASIILFGSIIGSMGMPGMTIYGASKAALRSFARTWSSELLHRRIRTNIISPGYVRTPPMEAVKPHVLEGFLAGVPMGRMGEPDEIAAVAAFLASDDASFVTGIELFADGGVAQVNTTAALMKELLSRSDI